MTKQILLRIPEPLADELAAQAALECNTRQGIIIRACREYLMLQKGIEGIRRKVEAKGRKLID